MSEWEEFTAYQGLIADAKREERERIIKLLEERAQVIAGESGESVYWYGMALSESIALIRGEEQ